MNAIDTTYSDLGLSLQQPGAKKQLGQDEFLRLLTTQLQHQDPFKPMENGEFLGQIAQFSTVSGIQDMQQSFSSLASALSSSHTLQAAGLVGRSVLVPSETGHLPADGELQAAAYLPAGGQLVVDIVDASGQVVRNLDLGTQAAGTHRFSWDGRNTAGESLPPGSYTLRARLVQGGAEQSVATLAVGRVDSVSLTERGVSLELNGLGIADLNDVHQIL